MPAALTVLGLSAVLLWHVAVPEAAEVLLTDALRERGLPVESLEVRALRPGDAVLADIRLGAAGAIERIGLTYHLPELLRRGRLERVTLSGLRLEARLAERGALTVPGLAPGVDAAGPSTDRPMPDDPPFDGLAVEDARLSLGTPLGPVDVAFEGDIVPRAGGGLAAEGRVALAHEAGRLALPLRAGLAPDGTVTAELEIASGRLEHAGLTLEGLGGWASLEGSAEGLRSLAGQLTAGRLAWPGGALEGLSLGLAGAPTPDVGVLSIGEAADPLAVSVAAEVRGAGRKALAVDADIAARSLDKALTRLGIEAPVSGAARLDAALTLPLAPLEAGRWRAALTRLDGSLVATLADLTVADRARDLDGVLEAAVAVDEDAVTLTGRAPWVVVGRRPDAPTELALTLDATPDGPHRLAVAPGRSTGIALEAAVTLEAAGAVVRGPIAVEADLPGPPIRLRAARIDLTSTPVRWNGLTVALDTLRATGAGTAARFRIEGTAALAVSGAVPRVPAALDDGRLRLDGTLRRDEDRLVIGSSSEMTVAFDRLAAAGWSLDHDPTVRLGAAGDGPLLVLGLTDAGPEIRRLAVAVAAEPMLRLRPPAGPVLHVDPGRLALRVEAGAGTAADTVTGTVEDARLAVPALGWAATAVDAEADLALAPEPEGAVTLSRAILRPTAEPPPVVPLVLRGRAEIGSAAVTASGRATAAEGALAVALTARHRLDTGRGRVEARLAPVTFAADGLQPGALFPILERYRIEEAAGTLAATARHGWGPGAGSAATLTLEDASFQAPGGSVAGLDAALRATSLVPLVLPPGQPVSVERIRAGLLLEDGRARFGIPDGATLAVEELAVAWAGGTLAADAFALPLDASEATVTLRARGVELGRLLEQYPVEDLTITGTVAGALPVRYADGRLLIDRARLDTEAPGRIRYSPEEVPLPGKEQPALDLVLQALENFHYDRLALTLDGEVGGELRLGLDVDGANPDLYGGYPIDLNVTVAGPLDTIVGTQLEAARLVQRTEERLERRARGRRGEGRAVTVEPAAP